MGIGHDGGRAPGQHRAFVFAGGDQGRFEVQVAVHEARRYYFPGEVDLPLSAVFSDAGDIAAGYGHVGFFQPLGKDVDDLGVFKNQFG